MVTEERAEELKDLSKGIMRMLTAYNCNNRESFTVLATVTCQIFLKGIDAGLTSKQFTHEQTLFSDVINETLNELSMETYKETKDGEEKGL